MGFVCLAILRNIVLYILRNTIEQKITVSINKGFQLVSFAAVIRVVTRHATLFPTKSVGRSVARRVTTLITAAKETSFQ